MKARHFTTLLVLFIMGSTHLAHAGDQMETGGWRYSAFVNLWGAGTGGELANGSEIDISFSDILENLDFTIMGGIEGRKGNWSWFTDVVYLKMSAEESGSLPQSQAGFNAEADVEAKVFNVLGGRSLYSNERANLDFIFGARYLDLDTDLKLTAGGPGARTSAGNDVWDGVIGFRGRTWINENIYLPYYFDYGTGDSDSTWQAAAGVGYKFGWGDVVLAYRHMEWEFDSDAAISEIDFSGPGLQARWYF